MGKQSKKCGGDIRISEDTALDIMFLFNRAAYAIRESDVYTQAVQELSESLTRARASFKKDVDPEPENRHIVTPQVRVRQSV